MRQLTNTVWPWCSREPVISVIKPAALISRLVLSGLGIAAIGDSVAAGIDYELGPDKQAAQPVVTQAAPPATAWLAGPRNYLSRTVDRITHAANHGAWEGYLPLHTHHMRFAYTQAKIDSYNENPFGIGMGRGYYDESGDWHGVFVRDSRTRTANRNTRSVTVTRPTGRCLTRSSLAWVTPHFWAFVRTTTTTCHFRSCCRFSRSNTRKSRWTRPMFPAAMALATYCSPGPSTASKRDAPFNSFHTGRIDS